LTGKVLELSEILVPDSLASRITEKWIEWDNMRNLWKQDVDEVRRYVYATDTSYTSNATNPWKNKTTIPKLCQIRDNLYSNYAATMYQQRNWLTWEANNKDSDSVAKKNAITNYMAWVISHPTFKHEMDKVILDYIDYGNCFVTVDWIDERVEQPDRTQMGYVGPGLRRINPLDIVFNPTAESFHNSPKIIRSVTSLGEIKKHINQIANDQNREEYESLWKYLTDIRLNARTFGGDWVQRDAMYNMDGFTSFRDYLGSDVVEILTFYGDIYDANNDEFIENHVITVIDRHKLINKKPNPSFFGYPPIFHSAWRKRQDNLWGMGPLSNLVGLQYRLDHVENMKADIFDLTTYPVQKVKGFVGDYVWQPGEKIFVSEEGDVDMIVPDVQALQGNFELDALERRMEEMAGSPRDAMGFRSPGEKTKYEVQRIENAGSRLFSSKIKQLEEQVSEPAMNAMLELAKRNMTSATVIKVMDDELKVSSFESLSVEDITGIGRIKPIAARHFAEQAEMIQNLSSLAQSNLWQVVAPHFSSIKLAKIFEDAFSLQQYEVVLPYVALSEQADAQKQAQALQEQVAMEATTASGMGEDYDMAVGPQPQMEMPE